MKLTKEKFQEKLKNQELVICIIGMSNIGKSLFSKKLTTLNFDHLCCDDIIEKILEPELKALGYSGLADMAKWLGHPYESQFSENQKIMMKHESAILQSIIKDLDSKKSHKNTTIDTTGSVIYAGENICKQLKDKSLIVYIEATKKMKEAMFERFLKNPKPIIWAHSFKQLPNESEFEALKRCYPDLLDYRSSHYIKYADVTIPYEKTDKNMSAEEFLELIKEQL